jgi:hypothetical protein
VFFELINQTLVLIARGTCSDPEWKSKTTNVHSYKTYDVLCKMNEKPNA